MAGPGGGPPRRSHTKSRKGCDTCKRRHIRCDENFPQCRNCTKHNCRCPYMDTTGIFPALSERSMTPEKADLMWTPDIGAEIAHWKQTSISPFPDVFLYPASLLRQFSLEDLRLLHHIASVSSELSHYDANKFTIWSRQVPLFMKIGVEYQFVMHALLALSATHLAWLTRCALTTNMAYKHRGIAMNGLHEAIGSFSRNNSDAVLAASLLLSWQESSWRGWTQLMHGTSSVIDAMQPWKDDSQFGDFIAEQSTFPTAPPSPIPGEINCEPQKKNLDALQQAYVQLQRVEKYFKEGERAFKEAIQQLMLFIQGVGKVSSNHTAAQRFQMLDPLRAWLFWRPVMFLKQYRASLSALMTIAYYYTIALVVEPLFPEVGAAYFGSLSLNPIEEIARQFYSTNLPLPKGNLSIGIMELMKYPIHMASGFRVRMGWVQSNIPLSLSASEKLKLNNFKSYPVTEFPSIFDTPTFSYSQEQPLRISPEPQSTISLKPGTYYHDSHLGIPSPYLNRGGYHTPDSSYFGEELNFFDRPKVDDFALYDSDENTSSGSSYGEFIIPTNAVWI